MSPASHPHPDPLLVSRSVGEFVGAVASASEAVPAGGSVVALTGACSAALLALVCGVLEHKHVAGLTDASARAQDLQQRLLGMVDLDAQAFRAFLQDKRSPPAIDQMSHMPVHIARACAAVVDLSREVEERTDGPLLGDVRAARHLATAALAAALDIADQDVPFHTNPTSKQRLAEEIANLRRSR